MIIDVKDLRKTYTSIKRGDRFRDVMKTLFAPVKEKSEALRGVTFGIERGEIVGLLGPNGAGKSTTIKILTGVLYPDSGEVSVLGFTPWKQRARYVAHIGAVFGQKSQLIWDIPPLDSFAMNAAIYGIPRLESRKRIEPFVELLGLESIVTKPTRNLSLGERMKCEFIMAMLHEPEVLFLDEPTIGLDIIAKDRIRGFIRELNERGVTIILTTHDMDDIEHLARRVIVINSGDIVFDNSIDRLRNHKGDRKIVYVKTESPRPDTVGNAGMTDKGVALRRAISSFETEYELDMTRIGLASFIGKINEASRIIDLEVKEPPIEEIVKNIYLDTSGTV